MCISAANKGRLVCLFAVWVLVGCTVGPDFKRPAAPTVSSYASGRDPTEIASADGERQHFSPADSVPADWWRLFNSSVLNGAVRQGLTASPTISGAEASLLQARDELRSGEGILYPQVTIAGGVSRQQPSSNGNPARFQTGAYNLFSLTGGIAYVLDIFGGQRRTVEALGAEVDYAENANRATSLALAATISNTLIAIAAYQEDVRATADIIKLEETQVHLAHVLATTGMGTYTAELSLQGQLDATQASLPALEQQLAKLQHLLAILEGRLPANSTMPSVDLGQLSLPQDIPLSIPSTLVQHRPDILQAEASLHAASAQIGIATAALFPSLTLDGSIGYSSLSSSNLFSSPSNLWSLGAGASQPIFNGGSLWYHKEAAQDAFNVADAQYRQTVLTAFEQVADSLRALEHDADLLSRDEQALQVTRRALKLVEAEYAGGLAPYSEVLLADTQLHQAEIAEIQAKAARFQDTVALFVSLGGGWWNEQGALTRKVSMQ